MFLMIDQNPNNKQVVVNLDPAQPELGLVEPPLPSMHNAKGCGQCTDTGIEALRINHYLGSIGDFVDKTKRYWKVRCLGTTANVPFRAMCNGHAVRTMPVGLT